MNANRRLAALERESVRSGRSGRHYDAVRQEFSRALAARADPATRHYLESRFQSLETVTAEYGSRLPTPDQSVLDYARLVGSKERLDIALLGGADNAPFQPRSNVVFGTIEKQGFDAYTTRCDEPDEYLIAFNRSVFTACLRLCNYVTAAFTSDSAMRSHAEAVLSSGRAEKLADEKRIWPVDRLDDRVVAALTPWYRDLLTTVLEARMPDPHMTVAFISSRTPEDARQNQARETRWSLMEDCVTDFIVAHEYAHVLLNHPRRADEAPTDERERWHQEYYADLVGLNLLVYTWATLFRGDALIMSWVLQSVTLFFVFQSHVERYAAEVLGKTVGVWRASKRHPPTWLRYLRLVGYVGRYEIVHWPAIGPHLERVEEFLAQMYANAVGGSATVPALTHEWRLQRLAFESIDLNVYPQQLVVATRAVTSALRSDVLPARWHLESIASEANREFHGDGIRPPVEVTQQLEAVALRLGECALHCSKALGLAKALSLVGELERVMLRDARARYVTGPSTSV